jgi:plasmid stabilization system protein ParE
MEEYTVRFTQVAQQRLDSIIDYIAADNPVRARTFKTALIERAMNLNQFPNQGPKVKKRGNLRKLNHGNYILFYRIEESQKLVEIVSCSHGAQIR